MQTYKHPPFREHFMHHNIKMFPNCQALIQNYNMKTLAGEILRDSFYAESTAEDSS